MSRESETRHIPGTSTSRFSAFIRFVDRLAALPPPAVAFALLLCALAGARLEFRWAAVLWLFMLGDWVLLALLPLAGRSFGPASPPTLLLALLRIPPALLPQPFAVVLQVAGTLLVIYGFWIEPQHLTLTRQSLVTQKMRNGVRPLRVLQFGDLHTERITARERALVSWARKLEPDLIVFTGDFLNLSYLDDPLAHEQTRSVLCNLSAPLGLLVVSGSPPVDRPDLLPELLKDLPIRWLKNERIDLQHDGETISVLGVTCSHRPKRDGAQLAQVLGGDVDRFTLLLYHSPDLAPIAAGLGIDLQLSGHTHGGQVRLPFFGAFYASSLEGKRFEAGRRQLGGLTLYVTRGVGLEGRGAPRVRFLCPPEMVLWEISGSGPG